MPHPQMASNKEAVPQHFPAGVRVLVVDNDITVLQVVEHMCSQCHYRVTTCSEALVALNLLRERKGCFDVILIDVHTPDMDAYDFLQQVSQEMNLPVIMMSVDAAPSAVMKAIAHGACDYWIKPLRGEQFLNMWQHVARKALRENKQHEILGILEAEDQKKRGRDDSEFASTVIGATEGVTNNALKESASKEAKACFVDETDHDYYPRPTKKPRVVWSTELHQQFVRAVMQLGVDKAVPKKILEVMNVPGLTREHVASHLQKYRHFLKKAGSTGETQQQSGMPKAVPGIIKSKVGESGGSFDFQALAATGHVPPETLASLQTEVIGCPGSNLMPKEDHSALLKSSSMQWPNPSSHAENTMMAYGHPQVSNIAKNVPHQSNMIVDDVSSSRYGAWPPYNTVDSVGINNSIPKMLLMKNNVLVNTLQLQEPQQQQSLMHVQINSINVQPPCLVVSGTPEGNGHASVNQYCGFGRHSLNSPQPNSSFSIAQFPSENTKAGSTFYGCTPPTTQHQQLPNSTLTTGALRSSPGLSPLSDTLHQASFQNLEYDGIKDTCRSAGLEMESSIDDFSRGKVSADIDNIITTKEEPNCINRPEEDHPFL